MPTRVALNQWDVVTTIFPFTDLSGVKRCPDLIVGLNTYGPDFLLAFISSRIYSNPAATDLQILSNHPDFPTTGLKVDSTIRLDKIVTLNQSLIRRRIGQLSLTLQKQAERKLMAVFGFTSP